MRSPTFLPLILGLLLGFSTIASAESNSNSGRGGPFIEFHMRSLSAFDPSLGGIPIVVGGTGYGYVAKNFRLGGSGGGGFAWNPSNDTHFAMGYGGALMEYVIAPWMAVRILLGGGGYDLERVVSQNSLSETVQRLGSGGFVLFYPSLAFTIPLQNWLGMQLNIGYFMPNDTHLTSLTASIGFLFGNNRGG